MQAQRLIDTASALFADDKGLLTIWQGDSVNATAAQQALLHRAICNRAFCNRAMCNPAVCCGENSTAMERPRV